MRESNTHCSITQDIYRPCLWANTRTTAHHVVSTMNLSWCQLVHHSHLTIRSKTRSTALHRSWSIPLCPFAPLIFFLRRTLLNLSAMSPSPALPWEVIERVIDHSASSTKTLYSFTLTCHDLLPRSTTLLLGRVKLRNRDRLFDLCAILQVKPHL